MSDYFEDGGDAYRVVPTSQFLRSFPEGAWAQGWLAEMLPFAQRLAVLGVLRPVRLVYEWMPHDWHGYYWFDPEGDGGRGAHQVHVKDGMSDSLTESVARHELAHALQVDRVFGGDADAFDGAMLDPSVGPLLEEQARACESGTEPLRIF